MQLENMIFKSLLASREEVILAGETEGERIKALVDMLNAHFNSQQNAEQATQGDAFQQTVQAILKTLPPYFQKFKNHAPSIDLISCLLNSIFAMKFTEKPTIMKIVSFSLQLT